MRIAVVGAGPGGLYFAILMKKARPDAHIEVFERNRRDDTFGFGVVFSDDTLQNFLSQDVPTYERIKDTFAHWDDIDFVFKGEVVRSSGHGFCGCGRAELLSILQERAEGLGVQLHFGADIAELDALRDRDLIVAADGINSTIREAHKAHFRPRIEWRRNRFVWLGTTKPYDAFTFDFTSNEHGLWVLGAYQYNARLSTWIVEAPEATWASARATLEGLDEAGTIAYMERLWADRLDGHRLIANRSIWRTFPTVRNERWSLGNIVLLGDALHTAHYSIGSGTKLAMEDAIALVEALRVGDTLPAALQHFETARREEVEKTQHAADVSVIWTENPARFQHMEPLQAAFSMLSRSKQVTYDNLRLRDPAFVDRVDRWFAGTVGANAAQAASNQPPPPPMFMPFRIKNMALCNRVVVSPMNMYSSRDGTPGDFHFVHFGSLALGGAGLIITEMTCISPEARITPGCAGMYRPDHVAAWKRIVDFVHENSDARITLQLGHAGRKGATRLGWEGMDMPLEQGGWPLVAPSPLPYLADIGQVPREMTRQDMDAVRAQFVRAAGMAERAGFDMIEVHMAHGYLLSSFITPVSNRRQDDYGGTLENRMRFPLEVLAAVRAAWPADKPVSVRISATDWVEHDGVTGEEAVHIANMLKDGGCDIVDVSAGQTTPDAKPVYGRMFQTPFSEQVRNEAGLPTMAVGNITTADQVNTILAAGRADLVCLARPHLTNPHFTLDASAYYAHTAQRWPNPYLSAKDQAFRLAQRDKADALAERRAARPDVL